MSIIFGSARYDENGNITGGTSGDQTGIEVSTQEYYMHEKGWYCIRAESITYANALATAMQEACDNNNIGYDQNQRNTVWTQLKSAGTLAKITTACEADCSSLIRCCVYQATGTDPGDFTTANEATKLAATGLFEDKFSVSSESELYNGDILVTKSKGHTVIVVSGRARSSSTTSTTSTWSATGTATATTKVNVRSGAGTSYSSYGTINKGDRFEVDGTTSGDWVHVMVVMNGSNVIGWIHKDYVAYDNTTSSSSSVDYAQSFDSSLAGTYKVVNTGSEGLNLRSGAGTTKNIIAVIPEGGTCQNYGYYTESDGYKWLLVTYGSYTGFVCSGGYLTKA